MMSKQNVPELRFPEFSGEWKVDTFNEIFHFYNNRRVPLEKNERKRGPYPYYGATGIIDYVDDYIFEGEYLLIGEDGANIVSRNAKLVYLATGKFWVNNHAHILKPKMGDDYFFYNALERINYVKYNSGTAQPKLNHNTIKKIKISYPQKEEQNKIGDFFSKLDRLIELEEKKLELLEEQKKGYMQMLFSQRLRFKDENGNDYPEWEEKKLAEITTKIGSGKTPKGGKSVYKQSGVLFLRSQNVQFGTLKLDDLVFIDNKTDEEMKNSRSFYGDVLLNITGASIGRVCMNTLTNTHANLNQHVSIIRVNSQVSPHFVEQYLISDIGQNKIFKAQSGGSREGLNFSEIGKLKIELPGIIEQKKIGTFLNHLNKIIKNEKKKRDNIKTLKEGLLQKLFI